MKPTTRQKSILIRETRTTRYLGVDLHRNSFLVCVRQQGQALFHNCDVSNVEFSKAEWRRRDNGKRMVFEEVVSLEHRAAEALKPAAGSADDLNYGLIAELYQQLKKNFDDRRDYWTAEDFHYGEMEMKRLSSGHHRVLRRGGLLERWFGRVLGSGRSMTVAARMGRGSD